MQEEKEKSYSLNGFTKAEAQTIIKNYISKASRGRDEKINETISVWFSYEEIKKFYDQLDSEVKISRARGDKNPVDGVRIYFANYGKDGVEHDAAYKHQNTLVLVSTIDLGVIKGPDDKPLVDSEGKPVHRHRDLYSNIKKTGPLNRGKLCPPESGCDCDEILITGNFCKEETEEEPTE